ncbi:hypothetical protein DYB34_002638 [Aphanomyces astaci]|uniref:Amidohydrolase-related domain-containing protein n=1 Tax=Aphanomyces astaci TaxID=112090 RepID=A0A418C1E9_APHAT|nr:hypothetical protein DYB34_002638 [Aphanomyces astaci]
MAGVNVDLVLNARHVVPVVPEGVVLENHSVVVNEGLIVAILPTADVTGVYIAAETVDLPDHILIPGLINAHTHASMTLLRGLFGISTLHSAAEMIRSGTTCANDMYFFPDAAASTFEKVGLRALVGQVVMEFPTAYATGPADYFAKARAMFTKYKDSSLISLAMAPHAPYTVSDASFEQVLALSREFNVRVHLHLHESEAECVDSATKTPSMMCHQSAEHSRPLQVRNMQRLGLLNDQLIAAHMTQLTDDEIAAVAAAGTHVSHCPTSNLKLASGICRVSDLLAQGVNVAIGTDGAASNNTLNMFAEMKLAAVLAKGESKCCTSVPAATALRMATLNGAKALGIEAKVGSVEVGKVSRKDKGCLVVAHARIVCVLQFADLVAVSTDCVEMLPMYSAISHVVYVAGRENVSDVWVAGKRLLANRVLTTIDEVQVKQHCKKWHDAIRDHHAEMVAAKK